MMLSEMDLLQGTHPYWKAFLTAFRETDSLLISELWAAGGREGWPRVLTVITVQRTGHAARMRASSLSSVMLCQCEMQCIKEAGKCEIEGLKALKA